MAKNELAQRVATRLEELGKKPIPAAVSVGLGRDYLRDLIEGRKESIAASKQILVAEACEWTISDLLGDDQPAPPPRSRKKIAVVPLLDNVAAGRLASPMSQIPQETAQTVACSGLGSGEFFALRVDGSSMNLVSPDGSVIIVNKLDRELRNGKFYVFSVRGETTFKRWNASPEYLSPYTTDTDAHKPIFVTKKRDLEVIGRVKRTLLDL